MKIGKNVNERITKHLPGRSDKNHETPYDTTPPIRDSNMGPLEYGTGAPTSKLQSSKIWQDVRFEVLTAACMKIIDFCDFEPRSLVVVDRRFRGAYCFHHQGYHRPDGES
jgi:hypothetical protein